MSNTKAVVFSEQLDQIPEGALLQASGAYLHGAPFTQCWIRRVPESLGGKSELWEVLAYEAGERRLTATHLIHIPATVLYIPDPVPTPEEVEAAARYPREEARERTRQAFVEGARWERARQARAATTEAQAQL